MQTKCISVAMPYRIVIYCSMGFSQNTQIKGSNFLVATKLKLYVEIITNIVNSVFTVVSSGSDFRCDLHAHLSIHSTSFSISKLLYSHTLVCVREYILHLFNTNKYY